MKQPVANPWIHFKMKLDEFMTAKGKISIYWSSINAWLASTTSEISKFADDTKIASQVNTQNDIRLLQRSLDK